MNFVDKHFGRLGNRMFQMAYIYAQFRDGTIPDIYLQNQKYFDKYREEIKQLYGENITYIDKVGIQVRRGDYVNNPFYVDLSTTDYYQRAIDLFPNEKFLITSDDIEFCKGLFAGYNVEFSVLNGEEGLKEFAGCKSQIIANSSFGWWAAYLNPNPDKKVIYPKNWFGDGVQRVGFPSEWMAL